MDDKQFIFKINVIAAESKLDMGSVRARSDMTTEVVASWALFLQTCVKRGITLSDDRWQRLSLRRSGSENLFSLAVADSTGRPDGDFRLGLQLLMGMLEPDTED